jgi:hypothetical protein
MKKYFNWQAPTGSRASLLLLGSPWACILSLFGAAVALVMLNISNATQRIKQLAKWAIMIETAVVIINRVSSPACIYMLIAEPIRSRG